MPLSSDYKLCEEIIKKHSKSFYQAFSMLEDEDARLGVFGVYAYCRTADDIIDEHNDVKALTKLKNDLDEFRLKGKTDDFIFRVLKDVANKFYPLDYDYKPYYDMIEGQEMDMLYKQYQTLDDLKIYCTKVASSVGEMLVPLLAPGSNYADLKQVAYDLGIAMQLTNILRDIGEDNKNNRIYIPVTVREKYGVTEDNIANGVINDNFIKMFEEIASVSYDHYDAALKGLGLFPKDSQRILTIALKLYKAIIGQIRINEYDVFTKKAKVPFEEKIRIIKENK